MNNLGYLISINWDKLYNDLHKMESDSDLRSFYWYDSKNEKPIGIGLIRHDEDYKVVSSNSRCTMEELFKAPSFNDFKNWPEVLTERIKQYKQLISNSSWLNVKLPVIYAKEWIVIKVGKDRDLALPKEYIEWKQNEDLSHLLPSQINLQLKGNKTNEPASNMLAVENDIPQSEMKNQLEEMKKNLQLEEEKAKNELDILREELRKKELALREELDNRLAEFRAVKDKMEDSIYMLELNIFALRSHLGDTFSIKQIKSGTKSEAPLVIYQKFKFLDEEIVLLSPSDIEEFVGGFEHAAEIFKHSKMQNVFAPTDKCITFFRVSKDSKYYALDNMVKNDIIEPLEYSNGDQLGMVIRNGENIYLSFIDEQIYLEDNLFHSDASVLTSKEKAVEITEEKTPRISDQSFKPMVNRKLIFYILEGLLKEGSIFPNMESHDLYNNEKVIFSAADGQITGYRYPDFRSFYKGWDTKELRQGDSILVLQNYNATHYSQYGNDTRGKGGINRDATIESGLQRINLIENITDWKGEYSRTAYYISCEKDNLWWVNYRSWEKPKRRNKANIEIYIDEFCPVDYIHTGMISEWIDLKHTGELGSYNYIFLVERLRELEKMLKGREEKEALYINSHINFDLTLDNLDKLVQWKKEKRVRDINEYQAKRFVKWYREGQK